MLNLLVATQFTVKSVYTAAVTVYYIFDVIVKYNLYI